MHGRWWCVLAASSYASLSCACRQYLTSRGVHVCPPWRPPCVPQALGAALVVLPAPWPRTLERVAAPGTTVTATATAAAMAALLRRMGLAARRRVGALASGLGIAC